MFHLAPNLAKTLVMAAGALASNIIPTPEAEGKYKRRREKKINLPEWTDLTAAQRADRHAGAAPVSPCVFGVWFLKVEGNKEEKIYLNGET